MCDLPPRSILAILLTVVIWGHLSVETPAGARGKASGCQRIGQVRRQGNWTLIRGPDSKWTNGVATVRGFAVDPRNPRVMYASHLDEVYRTRDGGCTWTPVFTREPPVDRRVSGYAFAYSFGSIAVAQTGRRLMVLDHAPPSEGGPGPRVLLSTNAGGTWGYHLVDNLGSPLRLDISPSDPSTIYLSANSGSSSGYATYADTLYVSTDGGREWSPRYSTFSDRLLGNPDPEFWTAIAIDPADPNELWMAGQVSGGGLDGRRYGLYHSVDGGKSWRRVQLGHDWRILDVSVHRVSGRRASRVTAYVLNEWGDYGIFWSEDGGSTWSLLPAPRMPNDRDNGSFLASGPGWKDLAVIGEPAKRYWRQSVFRLDPSSGQFVDLKAPELHAGTFLRHLHVIRSRRPIYFAVALPWGDGDDDIIMRFMTPQPPSIGS